MRRIFGLLAALAIVGSVGCKCIHETCDCCPDICSGCCKNGNIYLAPTGATGTGGAEELKKAPLPK
jgi:hypothetical protein